MAAVIPPASAQRKNDLRKRDEAFFATDEAFRIGEQVLLYQRETGGWPKNIDMAKPLTEAERQTLLQERSRRNDSTTDNGATTVYSAAESSGNSSRRSMAIAFDGFAGRAE